jgi:hypothetical protein
MPPVGLDVLQLEGGEVGVIEKSERVMQLTRQRASCLIIAIGE